MCQTRFRPGWKAATEHSKMHAKNQNMETIRTNMRSPVAEIRQVQQNMKQVLTSGVKQEVL